MMFPSKQAILSLASYPFVHARRRYFHAHHDYVACFSSYSARNTGGANPGNLSEKDNAVGGSEGGYGGSGISSTENQQAGGARGGPGGWNAGTKAARRRVDGEVKGGEWRRDTEDAGRDTGGSVAEMAKAGAVGAMEAGLKLGEVAKQTMDGMWDAAKETTENVRDTVADDSETVDRRTRRSNDKHVEDLRRRGGGYDLKDL
ncbi:uncharacterized protein LOC105165398 [Sesamum indicum]|uniref:Uncharacterized protein LOC105165398 n=1 Tax=Sesamum indicum TaxID=4182 RepID=A0A6I9TDG5_SESIN|nr:uncharacterized protein LOC105165398 [Sesamum indicum]